MTKGTTTLRSRLAFAAICGVLVAIAGLFWIDSPPKLFAQTDTTSPTVSSVAITSDTGDDQVYSDDDGVYGIGDQIEVTVTFDEDVAVTGSPQLEITIGSNAKDAAYKSTTDSKVVFSYTVAVGDSDTDGISVGADKLSLDGGTIKDGAANDADLSHSALSAQSGHKVDGIRPTITSINLTGSSSNQDGVHTIDEYLPAGVRFSENVYIGGYPGPQLKLNFEGTTKYADFTGAFPQCNDGLCVYTGFGARYGIFLDFEYMIAKGDLDLDGVAIDANSLVLNGGSIRDGAGNDAVLTHSAIAADPEFAVDGVPATVSSIAITSDPGSDDTYGAGDRVEVTVTMTEDVIVSSTYPPELTLDIGGSLKRAVYQSENAGKLVFSYVIQDGLNDDDGISFPENSVRLSGGGTTGSYTVRDATGTSSFGGNHADLSFNAVAGDSGHKVATSVQPQESTDAALSGLTLSGIDFGTFASGTTSYTADVSDSVTETTVTPTVNHSGASYVIKLGGVEDADGDVSLAEGSNVITVEVTAEDGETTLTYTVTVTRLATSLQNQASTDATLSGLTLSGVDFGTFASSTTSYTAQVGNEVPQTTVTPTVNDLEATYVIKLGGVTDADGAVSLAVGSNVITIEVTAEDDSTTKTYTVTVTRISAPDLVIPFVYTSKTSPWGYSPSFTLGVNVDNQGSGSSGSTTLRYYRSTDSAITSEDAEVGTDAVDDLAASGRSTESIDLTAPSTPGTYYYGACVDAVSDESDATNNCSPAIAWTVPDVSTDATLSSLTLRRVDFGTFTPGTTSYSASVANSVTQTTVTPTVNDSGASYVIKLGGVTDADGVISLSVGSNVITVEVTAEDDSTTQTYTVTITRATPPSTDAMLSALTLSGINFGTFASGTTSYTAQVANSVTETTVTPTVNDSGASYVIKLDEVEYADGVVSLSVGRNVITIEVTAEDGETTRTYTVTVIRAAPPSTDATLSGLTLSGINFGTFASGTTSYTAQVANTVSQTTVTPTVNDSGASYVIKLGGVTDADGVVALSVGSNVITVEVTAEDDSTTLTYTVTVTRTTPSTDATLSALTLSSVDFGTFAAGTTSYSAQVPNSVSQTTVTPTVNDSGASYVIKIGGVTDADGVITLSVGSNVIAIEVTAEDDATTRTYTVTVTRAEPPSTDATLSALTLSSVDFGTFAAGTTSYSAQAANSVTQTTVTPTVNDSGASYVIKFGGVTDADGDISLAEGSNVITVEVTAEDDSTTKTYTVTVTRAATSISAPDLAVPFVYTFTSPFGYSPSFTLGVTVSNEGSGSSGSTTLRYYRSDDSTITSGDTEVGTDAVGSLAASGSSMESIDLTAPSAPGTYYYGACADAVPDESDATNNCSGSMAFTVPAETSTDATLSALTLSGVNFGTFDSTAISYSAQVSNSVTETTVTPTVNHSGASYVIKLGGVTNADGTVSLAVGSNVITIEVTAEDGETTRTYTVTVIRATPPSTDATLSALTLSGINFGTFASGTTSYTAQVAYSVSETTVTPTVNDSAAAYAIKLGGVTDSDGVIGLAVGSNVITIAVTAEDDSTTRTYTITVTRAEPPSTDATLSGLTLSGGIDFGTFASGTTSYTAQVGNDVPQTTVTPTVNDSAAAYAIKLGGVTYSDGVIDLGVGSNVITIAVTAEDDSTTRTYTVTVTRLAPSTDAKLSGLTLIGVNFGTFTAGTTSYTAQVANSVSQTTVTPTVNDSAAAYVIKLGGVTDSDGVIDLGVGSNVITIAVTAEDDETTQTYTITVTRAEPPSTDATLSGLTLSGGIDFGTFASGTTSYTAQVGNDVPQTTVTPTVNDSAATYAIKLGGVTDSDGVIDLGVGSNVITIAVTAEDDETTQTYTITVTRAAPPSTDATLSALTLSRVDFGSFDSTTTAYTAQVVNTVTQTTVTPAVNDSGARSVIKLGGVTDSDGTVSLAVGSNVITVEVTAEDGNTTRTYTVTVTRAEPPSTDATLKSLSLSEISIGEFRSVTDVYNVDVDNSVTQTTVTPTVNDSGANYKIKLGGVQDFDGVVALAVGSNTITIEVTAEDGITTRTYTVKVTRAAPTVLDPLSTDAALSALTLSGVDFGRFDSTTTSYAAQVANTVSQTTVTPTVNDSGASYVIKLGGVTDADGAIPLPEGSNVITVEVTAEDGNTTRTYTVTVTRAESASTDATLSALTLSSVDFGTFDSTTTSYTAQVANSVTQTTITPTVNDSGASYIIKLGGVEDADGVVVLRVGSNVITVEVTAEDDSTILTYTVTVTRAEPASTDATLGALTLSEVDFGTFDSTTVSYTTTVANDVSQTTVTPTVNHSGASYVIKLNGTIDSDGVIPLSVGSNAITIEVTAEDGNGSLVYTLEVTRSEPATPGTSGQRLEDRYDANNNGTIEKIEVIAAINDYLFGEGDEAISKGDVIRLINLYLFG